MVVRLPQADAAVDAPWPEENQIETPGWPTRLRALLMLWLAAAPAGMVPSLRPSHVQRETTPLLDINPVKRSECTTVYGSSLAESESA